MVPRSWVFDITYRDYFLVLADDADYISSQQCQ
jgi:hypothetical protein